MQAEMPDLDDNKPLIFLREAGGGGGGGWTREMNRKRVTMV